MNYKGIYESKLTSAEMLAGQIENNWVLGMDAGPSQAEAIIAAICSRARNNELSGV